VRKVNTLGFPDAGVEEEGMFAVVISSTTGPVKNMTPVTSVVHLVSIEHLDATIADPDWSFSSLDSSSRVGLISLHSWTYTAVPEAVNFVEAIQNLAEHMQPLKPPESLLRSLKISTTEQGTPSLATAARILHNRLDNSYTICRWRTATGEETVAFNRGPLGKPIRLIWKRFC